MVTNGRGAAFATQATFPGQTITRNWQSLDAKLGPKDFKFLNTHLESSNDAMSTAQAKELVAGPLRSTKPVIAVGDYNSGPVSTEHGATTCSPPQPGQDARRGRCRASTCCRAELLADAASPASSLTERIDLVLHEPRLGEDDQPPRARASTRSAGCSRPRPHRRRRDAARAVATGSYGAGRWCGPVRTAILTVSGRVSRREADDRSGPLLAHRAEEAGAEVEAMEVVPDDFALIEDRLRHYVDEGFELIFTTGGTGFTPDDFTPEATRAVIDRDAPGIAEAMRAASLRHTPMAMLSRGVSGIAGGTLIVNFPGNPRAIEETFGVIAPTLRHAVDTLHGAGRDSH